MVSSLIGLPLHVHAEGLRGTGKTTIMRSARLRLPRIQRVKGCVYNCAPWAPHCPEHRELSPEALVVLGTEWVAMPFREISHSAKVGTVAGSIDLARITSQSLAEVALLPGTLPQAHRGIVFVDEINRLADTAPELADILLDVMGTKPGRLQVEETGLPGVDFSLSVSVWAASNPDEDPGPLEDIRKQLSDRFDFVIAMERPTTVGAVREILRASRQRQMPPPWPVTARSGVEEKAPDPTLGRLWGVLRGKNADDLFGDALEAGGAEDAPDWRCLMATVRDVECSAGIEDTIAAIYVDFGLESLRGVEAIHHGARLNCVLEGREKVTLADVAAVAPGALHHRLDMTTFARVMDYLTEKGDELARLSGSESPAGGSDLDRLATREALDRGHASAEAAPASVGASGGNARAGADHETGGSLLPSGQTFGRHGPNLSATSPGETLLRGLTGGRPSLWSRLGFGSRRFTRERREVDSSEAGIGDPRGGRTLADGPAGGRGGLGRHASRGGQGGLGTLGDIRSSDGELPVAPPHPARSLAEILQDLETDVFEPRGPRLP
jgi:magnesium chelatase subunit I